MCSHRRQLTSGQDVCKDSAASIVLAGSRRRRRRRHQTSSRERERESVWTGLCRRCDNGRQGITLFSGAKSVLRQHGKNGSRNPTASSVGLRESVVLARKSFKERQTPPGAGTVNVITILSTINWALERVFTRVFHHRAMPSPSNEKREPLMRLFSSDKTNPTMGGGRRSRIVSNLKGIRCCFSFCFFFFVCFLQAARTRLPTIQSPVKNAH